MFFSSNCVVVNKEKNEVRRPIELRFMFVEELLFTKLLGL